MESSPTSMPVPEQGLPRVQDLVKDFEVRVYRNGARHMYKYDENDKLRHISRKTANQQIEGIIADAYGTDFDTAADTLLTEYGVTARDAANNSVDTSNEFPVEAEIAPIRRPEVISRPARAAGETAVAASVEHKGVFSRIKTRIIGERTAGQERHRRGAAITIGVMGATALALLGITNHDSSPRGNAAAAVETTTTPANKSNTTSPTEAPTTTSPSANESAKTSAETQASLDSYHQEIAAIGLQNGQYKELGPNDVFPGPIEADQFSLNHGADAWANGNYGRNLAGAKQMGAELLAGTRHFTQSDSQVSHEAQSQVGHVPEDILKQLAANNWDGINARVITVNSPVYQNMTFNNDGKLQIEALRTGVGNDDAIMIITYKNAATGKFESFASRVDCSGFGQVFEKVTVPTPPTPPAETTPTTTPNKTTTTTVPKSTTTSTIVRTTTTIPGSTTSTTNIPTTTTPTTIVIETTTVPLRPKPTPAPVPGEITTIVPPDALTPHDPTTSIAPTPTTLSTLPAVTEVPTTAPQVGHQPHN